MFSHMYHKLHHKFKLVLKFVLVFTSVSVLCVFVIFITLFGCRSLHSQFDSIVSSYFFDAGRTNAPSVRILYLGAIPWFSLILFQFIGNVGLNCQTILNDLVATLTSHWHWFMFGTSELHYSVSLVCFELFNISSSTILWPNNKLILNVIVGRNEFSIPFSR